MYKRYSNNHLVIDLLFLIHLFLVLSINSCGAIPAFPHDLRTEGGVVPQELIKSLKQGETTREDLLLLLGAPEERGRQDRYFIYFWIVSESLSTYVVYTEHYFCVEFDEDNRIKRLKHIDDRSSLLKRAYELKYKWVGEVE